MFLNTYHLKSKVRNISKVQDTCYPPMLVVAIKINSLFLNPAETCPKAPYSIILFIVLIAS